MKAKYHFVLGIILSFSTVGQAQDGLVHLSDLKNVSKDFATKALANKKAADAKAISEKWPIKGMAADDQEFELYSLKINGSPNYLVTLNENAAITTNADVVRNMAPYNVNGAGYTVGVWDSGLALIDHQEFGSRVSSEDMATTSSHTTHVVGTIAATGVNPVAEGMAPNVNVLVYEWMQDTAEILDVAATGPNQLDKIQISNHSYGPVVGWATGIYSGNYGPHFFGYFPSEREDRSFGQYDTTARDWDVVAYLKPYYLHFRSAGNDRNDDAPADGTPFYYYDMGWQSAPYDSSTSPHADHYDGGYDTVPNFGNSKNIMTVGAVYDGVVLGVRDLAGATMDTYSGWGPADDGRVKPDIVANGNSLYSTKSTSTSSYGNATGTSMSSPNAAGSAVLLVDYYDNLFPGESMLASTIKGLIIHTADDLYHAGPDYRNGWGLMNTLAAADQITQHADSIDGLYIHEDEMDDTNVVDEFLFAWDGVNPIRATICWTDPPGVIKSTLDDRTPDLVNDLDIRITAPDNSVFMPYVLDVLNPDNAATTGDNVVDNVEMIDISSPPMAGIYSIRVTYKNSLLDGNQVYSLFLSGQDPTSITAGVDDWSSFIE